MGENGALPLPALSAEQMAEVDRLMTKELGVETLQLMELAGQAVAAFTRNRFLGGDARKKRVIALCGSGGNGGDAMVAARLLSAWGATVAVYLTHAAKDLKDPAAHQATILQKLGITPVTPDEGAPALGDADIILDGLLGFSLKDAPHGATQTLIEVANRAESPVVAIDVPSGLDATTGETPGVCIRAAATLTLALPKKGLGTGPGRSAAGDVTVADIDVPPLIYSRIGVVVDSPPFATRSFVPWP
jgi:NAD(P)H-hydrate epimerase